jgi:hypothetical protein
MNRTIPQVNTFFCKILCEHIDKRFFFILNNAIENPIRNLYLRLQGKPLLRNFGIRILNPLSPVTDPR